MATKAVCLNAVEVFQSGTKWKTDQPADEITVKAALGSLRTF